VRAAETGDPRKAPREPVDRAYVAAGGSYGASEGAAAGRLSRADRAQGAEDWNARGEWLRA
jgi:hypothetical protein